MNRLLRSHKQVSVFFTCKCEHQTNIEPILFLLLIEAAHTANLVTPARRVIIQHVRKRLSVRGVLCYHSMQAAACYLGDLQVSDSFPWRRSLDA